MLHQCVVNHVTRSVQVNQGAVTWNATRRKAAVWHMENVNLFLILFVPQKIIPFDSTVEIT